MSSHDGWLLEMCGSRHPQSGSQMLCVIQAHCVWPNVISWHSTSRNLILKHEKEFRDSSRSRLVNIPTDSAAFSACLAWLLGQCLLVASRACCIGDWCLSVCMWSTFFSKSLLVQFVSHSHETWHTWSVFQYAKSGTDFRNFDFKIFGEFF